MPTTFEMEDDGTSHEIDITKNKLESDRVYCIVDCTSKNIYLWLGKNAGVRKRFIGAQYASKIRVEYGFNFSVKSLDEGEEPSNFLTVLSTS